MYTRVYTLVYLRVYNSVHACTQLRSKYSLCRGLVCSSIGANTWTPQRWTKALYRMWNNPPRELETRIDIGRGACVSPKISGRIVWLVVGAYCV